MLQKSTRFCTNYASKMLRVKIIWVENLLKTPCHGANNSVLALNYVPKGSQNDEDFPPINPGSNHDPLLYTCYRGPCHSNPF